MAKRAVILLAEGFEEIEAIAPIDILRRAGIEVILAGIGPQNGCIKSARGISVCIDKRIEELHHDFDACILPGGGKGSENLSKSDHVNSLISIMFTEKKIVAAICASPAVVLAPAGVLNHKRATCFPGLQNLFPDSATYQDDPVVVDGNLITSQGPATAIPFALAIVELLLDKNTANSIRSATLWSSVCH